MSTDTTDIIDAIMDEAEQEARVRLRADLSRHFEAWPGDPAGFVRDLAAALAHFESEVERPLAEPAIIW